MKQARAHARQAAEAASDRRKENRYLTTIDIHIRFLTDGTPILGQAIEMGPNGMRVITQMPLSEAAYVRIGFDSASNNTYCEGRVVWTKKGDDKGRYESGVDIQRWGGDVPGQTLFQDFSDLQAKPDRRKRPR